MTERVLLADSHEMFRSGLRIRLVSAGIQVVAEARDGAEAVAAARSQEFDVIVIEPDLPHLSGIDALERMRMDGVTTPAIVLSGSRSPALLELAVRAGAAAYVSKTQGVEALVQALHAIQGVARGDASSAPRLLVREALRMRTCPGGRPQLTLREIDVLQGIAEGASSVEIARELGLSARTVESHRRNLMRKLRVDRTAKLVRVAIREGLIAA